MLKDSPDNVIFRCSECGRVKDSLGALDAHIEVKHTGFGPYNLIPNPLRFGTGDRDRNCTEVYRLDDAEPITLDEVEGL